MRTGVLLSTFLLFAQATAQTGSIKVTVRDATTGQPLASTPVSLSNAVAARPGITVAESPTSTAPALPVLPPRDQIVEIRITSATTNVLAADGQIVLMPTRSMAAITDSAGVAVFTNVPAGDYVVSSVNAGMPSSASVALTSSTAEVELSVARGAKISGGVHDESGRPISNAYVWAGMPSLSNDRVMLSPRATARADANGSYVLTLNREGTYYLRAENPRLPGTGGTAINLAGAYYPGVTEIERATLIPIRAGDTVVGVDLSFPEQKVFSISGKVSNESRVESFVVASHSAAAAAIQVNVTNSRPGPNGEFTLTGIPAGSWDVYPAIPLVVDSQRSHVWGRARVDVSDRDVTDVEIQTYRSRSAVRFIVTGLPNAGGVRLGPARWLPVASPLTGPTRSTIALTDREQVLDAVAPGRYRLHLAPPRGYYIADLRVGATSVFESDGIIEVADSMDPVQIAMRAGGGTIAGTITGLPEVTPASRVVLIPSGARRDNLMLYKINTIAAASSSFSFENVAPGDYKVFAWQSPPAGVDQSPAFAARYEDQGVTIRVVDAMTTSVEVSLIPE